MDKPKLMFSLYDRKNYHFTQFTKAEDVVDFLWGKELEDYTLAVTNSCGNCWMSMAMVDSEVGNFEVFLKAFKDE